MTSASQPAAPALPAETGAIDASAKWPAMLFFASALAWLLAGTLLALITSLKLHLPSFLDGCAWLTYGRVRAAQTTALVYGWGTNAAFGVALWLMVRLSRATLRHGVALLIAGSFWNVGVTVGVFAILAGQSASFAWLEIPGYVMPLLLVAYALIAVWALLNFHSRRGEAVFISQWYLLAALFLFPWIYSVAMIMLFYAPVRGTMQPLVNWWYAHDVMALWFTPVGLAAIYYFLPKILGRPIRFYYLAKLAFWMLLFLFGWTGVHHLMGGPVPSWVQTLGSVAAFLMVVPLFVIGLNHYGTLSGRWAAVRSSPVLRFVAFGAVAFTLFVLQDVTLAFRDLNRVLHFTLYTDGHTLLGLYAFFSMVMFGALYYILPRLLLREWPSARLIALHFWCCALGVILYVAAFTVGGIQQGLALNDAQIPFINIVGSLVPYLELGTLAWILLALGHLALAVNFVKMICTPSPAGATAAALFTNPPAMEAAAR